MCELQEIAEGIRVWSELRHKNLLTLMGFTVDDANGSCPAIISEWTANGTVSEFLKNHTDVDYVHMVNISYFSC